MTLRTPDKTAIIKLFNRAYKVSANLARRRVEVRYDPEHLHQIEIYLDGSFRQRAKPLQVSPHRAPKEPLPLKQESLAEGKIDYLGWLTREHKKKTNVRSVKKKMGANDNLQGFISTIRDHIHPDVFDPALATEFFETFGPFDLKRLKDVLTDLLAAHPTNLHLSFYFNHIQNQLFGDKS